MSSPVWYFCVAGYTEKPHRRRGRAVTYRLHRAYARVLRGGSIELPPIGRTAALRAAREAGARARFFPTEERARAELELELEAEPCPYHARDCAERAH